MKTFEHNTITCKLLLGLQTDIGHISDAVDSLNAVHSLWRKFGFTSSTMTGKRLRLIGSSGRREYPLRPEMVESIYHVHEYFKAHGDETVASSWIEAGRVVLESLEKTRVTCGYASVKNVETTELEGQYAILLFERNTKVFILAF